MAMLIHKTIKANERGFLFRNDALIRVLKPGARWILNPRLNHRLTVVSVRDHRLKLDNLDLIVRSGLLADEAEVVDLKDHERGLVWIDGRFHAVLVPGLHVFWKVQRDVRVETVDARAQRFEHRDLEAILSLPGTAAHFQYCEIKPGHVGLWFADDKFRATLDPGLYAFWRTGTRVEVATIDLRETVLDVSGQEIMTADRVTLRMNAVVTFRVVDALKGHLEVGDVRQALYREAQLAIRSVIGRVTLDEFLEDKQPVAVKLENLIRDRGRAFGLEVVSFGIRDLILPGEMKVLLNRVVEAKKVAEASLITRREETAALRSQANTAKILESNPTLIRMRELETLEKIAQTSNLTVVLGEEGITNRVTKMI
jgi:regulator of protease activity HflC (stomatin/prohibitin superfamily)